MLAANETVPRTWSSAVCPACMASMKSDPSAFMTLNMPQLWAIPSASARCSLSAVQLEVTNARITAADAKAPTVECRRSHIHAAHVIRSWQKIAGKRRALLSFLMLAAAQAGTLFRGE